MCFSTKPASRFLIKGFLPQSSLHQQGSWAPQGLSEDLQMGLSRSHPV